MNYHRDKDYIENESLFRNIFKKRANLLKVHLGGVLDRTPRYILDIGCSNGVFLDLYKEEGWETWGVEPSGAGMRSEEKGHRITHDVFERAKLPEDYFDLIILNHTLEHMDNPAEVLKKVYGLLKSGGIILVDVPNAGGLGARILGKYWPLRLPQEHKWQFTKESLSKLFRESGFEILTFKSRSGIFEYANPLLELSRPRFLFDLLATPYSLIATVLNMGDSMSMIGKKAD